MALTAIAAADIAAAAGEVVLRLALPKYTVVVKAVAGKIVEAPPIIRSRWMGKDLTAFIKWHDKLYGEKCLWEHLPSMPRRRKKDEDSEEGEPPSSNRRT